MALTREEVEQSRGVRRKLTPASQLKIVLEKDAQIERGGPGAKRVIVPHRAVKSLFWKSADQILVEMDRAMDQGEPPEVAIETALTKLGWKLGIKPEDIRSQRPGRKVEVAFYTAFNIDWVSGQLEYVVISDRLASQKGQEFERDYNMEREHRHDMFYFVPFRNDTSQCPCCGRRVLAGGMVSHRRGRVCRFAAVRRQVEQTNVEVPYWHFRVSPYVRMRCVDMRYINGKVRSIESYWVSKGPKVTWCNDHGLDKVHDTSSRADFHAAAAVANRFCDMAHRQLTGYKPKQRILYLSKG